MSKFGDIRARKGRWAPGEYFGKCDCCKEEYMGDKRARVCADCAYDYKESNSQVEIEFKTEIEK